MANYDVIILGTGGVGSAAAYHLAKRGAKVLGIDQFPGGHDRGSSHGETRVIRQAYFEHPDYVPLLRASALTITACDAEGEVRAVELAEHPFFLGTLFLPQHMSSAESPHPIISGFVNACRECVLRTSDHS